MGLEPWGATHYCITMFRGDTMFTHTHRCVRRNTHTHTHTLGQCPGGSVQSPDVRFFSSQLWEGQVCLSHFLDRGYYDTTRLRNQPPHTHINTHPHTYKISHIHTHTLSSSTKGAAHPNRAATIPRVTRLQKMIEANSSASKLLSIIFLDHVAFFRDDNFYIYITFSHLADALIQSDLQ